MAEIVIHHLGVMRDTSCHRNHPNSYWVYVTNLAMPEIFSWDAAFVRLLEHHDMHPPADNAGFAYVDCTASPFVCNVWQVDYPALVHFLVRDESPDPSEINPDAFDAEPKDLRQVDVRIFDLGLQQNSTTLSPGVFPTEFEQMRSLTANEGAYTVEEPYDELGREYHRFHNLYYTPACNLQGSFLDYSSELDNFIFKKIMKPIGLEYAADIYAGIAFLCSLNLAFIGLWIYRTIEDFFSSFLGRPTEFDELAQRMEERQDFADSGGFMGDMMQHFIDGIEAAFEANQSATGVPGEVTAAADARKAMFAGLRTNMSSVLAQG